MVQERNGSVLSQIAIGNYVNELGDLCKALEEVRSKLNTMAELKKYFTQIPIEQAEMPLIEGTAKLVEELSQLIRQIGRQQLRSSADMQHQVGDLKATVQDLAQSLQPASTAAVADSERAHLETVISLVDDFDDACALVMRSGNPDWHAQYAQYRERISQKVAEFGLQEVPGAGTIFDARCHESIGERAGAEPNQIVEVVRRGFIYNGALIRRAKVIHS